MEENWKDVKGFECLYQVSDLGRVKSFPRATTSGRILSPSSGTDGYLRVSLCRKGKPKPVKIHKLVVENFIGLVPSKLCIDHLDGNRKNNNLSNLEIVTYRENAIRGLRCEKNPARTSKFPGVFRLTKKNKWSAVKSYGSVQYNLGVFETEQEAKKAYELATEETCKAQRKARIDKRSSRFKGVSFDKSRQKWTATYQGKFLGRFKTEQEAFNAREEYKLQ